MKANNDSPTRLLLVDHRDVLRAGLRNFLDRGGIEVIGEAVSTSQAVQLASRQDLDLVLVGRVASDGLQVLREVKGQYPQLPVVLFAACDNPTYVARSMALGASGCIQEDCTRGELLSAIQGVAAGSGAWTPQQLNRYRGTPTIAPELGLKLTPRESQVLRQLAFGLSNKEIGQLLDIGVETVKEHVGNILRKLDVTDRTKAAVWAVRNGLD